MLFDMLAKNSKNNFSMPASVVLNESFVTARRELHEFGL